MRRYQIVIDGGPTYDSQLNGVNNPGASLVELDIPVVTFDQPMGGALVRIWGVPLSQISQASNLNNKGIKVYGGFGPGLPLANPSQYGLLLQGYIFQAYGNWISENQTLDLIVLAGNGPTGGAKASTPKNLSLNWPAGMTLSDAIKTTLTAGYPGYTYNININPNLKFSGDLPGYYQNITQFSQYVKMVSKSILNDPNYQGVSITLQGTTFTVYDGSNGSASGSSSSSSATPATKTVAFTDLIGQPTWINAPNIQFKCAMRADFKVGDTVVLPKTQVTNSAAAQTSLVNQNVAFQGNFQIQTMRHVGNSRQPDANDWVSVYEAFPLQQAAK